MLKQMWNPSDTQEIINRIQKLSASSQPLWGKMSVGQMLAHCNVTYELIYENKHPKPNVLMRMVLKLLVKDTVVNEKKYKRNSATGPVFIIKETKDFDLEKKRLIEHIQKTQQLGESFFDGKESHSFGVLKGQQWNNMLYKHLDHHLNQFGAI